LAGRFGLRHINSKAAPANEKSGVTEGFWQCAISKAVCLPGFFKGVMDE
jgi:hypothetical protein